MTPDLPVIAAFVRDLSDVPSGVLAQANRCLLDLAGIAIAGSRTPMSQIMRDHVAEHYGSGTARMLADGRRVSPVGAAMAGAATIDSLDGHDGHDLTKGHTGAAVLPALLAFCDGGAITGAELLTGLVIGYEIGTRAGIALHATAPDYHTSGAWNALACAAVGARAMCLDPEQTGHALGIAEFHGPRSQMMRCIDHPTMVKDGSAQGAAAGVGAALLAARGYTGAPALTTTVAGIWDDLGQRWRILEQYFKSYPVCRWAHPAIRATLELVRRHELRASDVAEIEVRTFHQAVRLAVRNPVTTEQAQYSLPFAVALTMVHGKVDATSLTNLSDPAVRRLPVTVSEDTDFSSRFPHERLATVRIRLTSGRVVTSPVTRARGGPDDPLTDAELRAKATTCLTPVIGEDRTGRLLQLIDDLPGAPDCGPLLDVLLQSTPISDQPRVI